MLRSLLMQLSFNVESCEDIMKQAIRGTSYISLDVGEEATWSLELRLVSPILQVFDTGRTR